LSDIQEFSAHKGLKVLKGGFLNQFHWGLGVVVLNLGYCEAFAASVGLFYFYWRVSVSWVFSRPASCDTFVS
jgi:hypothetical protein